MKRLLSIVLGVWLLPLSFVATAADADAGFVEGIEYQRLSKPQPTSAPEGKIEVLELFWYGCPHCYHFEPFLNEWLQRKADDVHFTRVPAQMNPAWQPGARAFYTAEILGLTDKSHSELFHAIHRDRRPMSSPKDFAEFFERFGVEQGKFLKVYHSFGVRAKMAQSNKQVQGYGANSVPTIIVNGKYRTNATMAGGTFEDVLAVVDFLVQKERAETK